MRRDSAGAADGLLILEVVLVVLLFALGVALFVIPAAQPAFLPDWWAGVLLAILFFAVVVLETLRRRRRSTAELHRVLDEPVDHSPPEGGA